MPNLDVLTALQDGLADGGIVEYEVAPGKRRVKKSPLDYAKAIDLEKQRQVGEETSMVALARKGPTT